MYACILCRFGFGDGFFDREVCMLVWYEIFVIEIEGVCKKIFLTEKYNFSIFFLCEDSFVKILSIDIVHMCIENVVFDCNVAFILRVVCFRFENSQCDSFDDIMR